MKIKLTVLALAVLCFAAGAAEARGYGHHGDRHGGHRYSHGYHHGAYAHALIGSVVLGALLAPPRYAAAPPVVYVSPPAPVVIAPPPVASTGRRLLRDSNGNCFERLFDGSGREVSVSLSPAECLW